MHHLILVYSTAASIFRAYRFYAGCVAIPVAQSRSQG